jgi:hypothetical protein
VAVSPDRTTICADVIHQLAKQETSGVDADYPYRTELGKI